MKSFVNGLWLALFGPLYFAPRVVRAVIRVEAK